MLYLAIPAQNEVATIGVLLWRLRTVLAEFPREYEVVVYDDASADETADVAEQYAHAMPVTVLRGAKSVGYAGAIDALVRYVSGQTRYPRRDAMLLLQGDFTDPPGIVPEFARRFEGGADLVIGERTAVVDAPKPVKRLFAAAGWALRPFVKIDGVKDLTSSMRLVRISVLRDALRVAGDAPLCAGDSWTANADLLLRLVPHARRVESVPMEPTYGVRMRETRRVTVRDALATLRWGWSARGRRAVPTTAPESATDANARPPRGSNSANGNGKRRDEPEMTAERLRERKRDRDRPRTDSSLEDAAELARREKGRRDRRDARTETLNREAIDPAAPRDAVDPPLPARPPREERLAREERAPREERARDTQSRDKQGKKGSGKSRQRPLDLDEPLDDPFAAPASSTRRNSRDKNDRDTAPAIVDDSPYADELERPSAKSLNTDATRADAVTGRRNDAVAGGSETVAGGDIDAKSLTNESGETDGAEGVGPETDGNETEGADTEGAETEGAETEGGDAATRERKRRRNRRSRRRKGRAKSGGATGEASADGDTADGDSSQNDSAGSVAPRTATNRSPAHLTSGSDAATDADGDSDSSSDSDSSDAGLSEEAAAQARAKRRGRRGRRGGARRSKNRGKSDSAGDGPADGPAGDGSDAGA